MAGQAEVGAHAVRPVFAQGFTIAAPQVDAHQAAGHRVEAGGHDEQVAEVFVGRGANPGRDDRFDRRPAQVHQLDVVLVEGVVVPLLQRWALHAEGVGRFGRREDLGHGGVVHSLMDLGAPEVVRGAVRRLVDDQVGVAARPEREPTLLPQALVVLEALAFGHVEGADPLFGVGEPAVGPSASLEDRRVLRLGLVLILATEAALLHGQRHDRRSLEHRDVLGHPGGLLDHLDAARTRPDHRHPAAGQIDPALGPVRSVGPDAIEGG